MASMEREVDRVLTLLRNKIRENGFTQLQVQSSLSWGRSYISQLLTKQKALRVEQVLLILEAVGANPAEFFAELYRLPNVATFDSHPTTSGSLRAYPSGAPVAASEVAEARPEESDSAIRRDLENSRALLRGLVQLMLEKSMIDDDELTEAVEEWNTSAVREPAPAAPLLRAGNAW